MTDTKPRDLLIEHDELLAKLSDVLWDAELGNTLNGLKNAAQEVDAAVERLHNFLAQPEPEAPTDEELEEFALQNGGGYFNCDCQAEADILTRKHVSNYRVVLARWGK